KNHCDPVGVDKVESFKAKLEDIGGDLGVMVCPSGFTEGARNRAVSDGIQLYEIYDPALKNTNLFIPLRYVEPAIKTFQIRVQHRAAGSFSLPADPAQWRFHIGSAVLDSRQLVAHAWNEEKIPQTAGVHTVDFNAMTVSDSSKPGTVEYVEIALIVTVVDNY